MFLFLVQMQQIIGCKGTTLFSVKGLPYFQAQTTSCLFHACVYV